MNSVCSPANCIEVETAFSRFWDLFGQEITSLISVVVLFVCLFIKLCDKLALSKVSVPDYTKYHWLYA